MITAQEAREQATKNSKESDSILIENQLNLIKNCIELAIENGSCTTAFWLSKKIYNQNLFLLQKLGYRLYDTRMGNSNDRFDYIIKW